MAVFGYVFDPEQAAAWASAFAAVFAAWAAWTSAQIAKKTFERSEAEAESRKLTARRGCAGTVYLAALRAWAGLDALEKSYQPNQTIPSRGSDLFALEFQGLLGPFESIDRSFLTPDEFDRLASSLIAVSVGVTRFKSADDVMTYEEAHQTYIGILKSLARVSELLNPGMPNRSYNTLLSGNHHAAPTANAASEAIVQVTS